MSDELFRRMVYRELEAAEVLRRKLTADRADLRARLARAIQDGELKRAERDVAIAGREEALKAWRADADIINALTAERDRYKAALERIAGFSPVGAVARNVAYEALAAAPEEKKS
jgi:hypothetical protein